MDKEPIEILIDIIRSYMSLSNEQIWQYNLERNIANINSLYVVVHYMTSVPISSISKYEVDEEDVGHESIFSTSKEFFRIEIASFDRSAINRKEEISHALKAFYSQEMQTRYGFRIFPLTNMNNVSTLTGGRMLNRFMIDLYVLVTKKSIRTLDYYNNFPVELNPNP